MIRLTVQMILLAVLVTFVACNAPPVPLDDIVIEKTFTPERCDRLVKSGDFVRYHYIGMFPDGKKFDSRLVQNACLPSIVLHLLTWPEAICVCRFTISHAGRADLCDSQRPTIVNIYFCKAHPEHLQLI